VVRLALRWLFYAPFSLLLLPAPAKYQCVATYVALRITQPFLPQQFARIHKKYILWRLS
jgi:hypothetical protein